MIRCTTARVDLTALEANFKAIGAYLANESGLNRGAGRGPALAPGIIAVVKANAYGHGARRVAATLEAAGATMLAVADIEEGVDLRKSGVRAPILVFGALSVSDLDGVFDHDLTPTISSPAAGEALQAAAAKRGATLHYHLKIDTGMNRLGFRHDNLRRTLPALLASPNLALDAVHTHFGTADEPGHKLFETQRDAIRGGVHGRSTSSAPARGCAMRPTPRRCCATRASGSTSCGPASCSTAWCRRRSRSTIALKPVMSLTSRVVAVKGVRVGENRRLRRPIHGRSPRDLGCHSRRLR